MKFQKCDLSDTLKKLSIDVSGSSNNSDHESVEIQPMIVRKTPKFPSRERHKAIRRKIKEKLPPPADLNSNNNKINNNKCEVDDDDDDVVQLDRDIHYHDRLKFNENFSNNNIIFNDGKMKTCQACKCPRDTHAIYHDQMVSVRDRLGFKPDSHTSKVDPRQMGYTWVPPGLLTSAKIQRYFDSIPQDKVPKIGSTGERHRDKQLAYQLPKQDLAMSYCKHVESMHRGSYEDFVSARNEIALDIGYIKDAPHSTKCVGCSDPLGQNELAVIAPKFREQMMWHPRCFSCSACNELLVDLTYCVHDDKIFCERHYAEMLKPRCNACDELKNMGIVLSAVVGAVGAVELVSVLHYISDEWLLNQLRTQNRDTLENALSKYQDEIRNSIAELGRRDSESVNYMQDGVAYENGFRQNEEPVNEELRLKFERRLKEILQASNIGATTSDANGIVANGLDLAQGSSNTVENESKSMSTSDITHELANESSVNVIDREPVESVPPLENQSDVINESIDSQFEIITSDECRTSTDQSNEDIETVNDLELMNKNDFEILNNEKLEENEEADDSSTFPSIYFDEYDRSAQVDEEYLRTLDGVKHRPLIRDDGTGRRRAFKKRSSSSSLSQEMKSSREEELKMFTSLEEAEFETMKNDFVPIKYSSEPNLASTSSSSPSSSSSTSPNSSNKSHRHRHKHRNISDTNIAEIDEENDENESEKIFDVDVIHSDDVTHPWGDIKPEARRGSDFLKTQISIEEEPELNLDNSENVTVCDEYEEAETKSQYQEAINVLKKHDSKDDITVDNHRTSPIENRIPTDRHVSMDDNSFPSASIIANAPAIFAITNATTFNITNNNIQATPASAATTANQTDKFDELTNRLQRIEQAIEQKITDWSKLPHRIDDAITEEPEDSDEEPDYTRRKKKTHQKLDYDQVELDFEQILHDNEIEFNEDTSYLPKLKNVQKFRVLESDEEPNFKHYSSNSDISDESDPEQLGYIDQKSRRLRKHKRHNERVYYESDEEPYYGRHNQPIKRKQHDDKREVKHKRISDEMFDELSDTKDGVYTSTIIIGNAKEFVLDSDEEPASKIENTGAIPKFCTNKEQVIARVAIPQLGLVRSYTYDSDEEPYYLEKRISLDEQLTRSAIAQINRENYIFDDAEYKKRLYDEYEIEENDENIIFCPKINCDYIYTCESDEEPYYDEKRLIREHQRRSKSPSRSPPIRPNNENMLGMAMTQNFLDLEREIDEEDRSTRLKSNENVIHLGLLGNTRIKTTKHYEETTETSTETIVETTSRRKYKWEEKVASTITSYHRGELKTVPSSEGDEDNDGNDEDHMWASENEDTQKSVIERKLDSDHDSIDEIRDEEVPNGAQAPDEKNSDTLESADEGAIGGSDDHNLSISVKLQDVENIIEPNETQDNKTHRDELNIILAQESTTAELTKDDNADRESSLTSSGEEIRKLEASKNKDNKKRITKKKKKSIGEKTDDFIKLETSHSKPSKKVVDETKQFIANEAGSRNRDDSTTSISKFDRDLVYDEFLLNETQSNNEEVVVASPIQTKLAKSDQVDTEVRQSENEATGSEEQPSSSSESPECTKKRKSIARPDPIYLLKESMYPFY